MMNDRQLRALQPGRYPDQNGLLVRVTNTSRVFRFRYQMAGKRREVNIGRYPGMTLAQARAKAAEMRAAVREGVDPCITPEPEDDARRVTFTQAAARYIRAHRRGWSNRKHARQWAATMRTYARPTIGGVPVDEITTAQVLDVLRPIWSTRTETAKRVQGRMENILDAAAAHGWRDASNPARWRGHLDKLLPRPTKVTKVRHQPAMPYPEVGAFYAELERVDGFGAMALRLLILTATRTSEVLGATWGEIDLERAVWTIPAARMKARREHRVPLSTAAIVLLRSVPRVRGEAWVFPGARTGRPLSNMGLLMTMRRLGYGVNGARGPYVPHGFRSSFRDFCSEVSSAPRAVAESALAHVNGDKTEAAYARSDLFERRRELMNDWATWITAM